MSAIFSRIAVIGVGLIGASIARAVAASGAAALRHGRGCA
jgi:prephenate dehydrogenase